MKRYARLKGKMLLLVVLGTLLALAAALVLWEVVVDGLLQDAFARGVLWACQNLFGYDEAGALEVYQTVFRNHKGGWLALLTVLLMLAAFYLALGRFTRWLDQIGAAVRQVMAETGEPVSLPRELRPLEEDLRTLQHTLEDREAQAREAKQRRQDLVAFLAHDLKTPLTSVVSYAELLGEEEDLPPHVRDYIRILNDKARRLQVMVQDVFEVSKAASGELPLRLERLDLGRLLAQTLADMDEAIAQSGLQLRTALPGAPVWITADGDRLYRVFQNLLQNALQYALAGSRVYVSLEVQSGWAEASVKNTSREELPAGVDFTARFVRGDASRTDGGSGLGLAIASSFAAACGGSLLVETDADLFTARVRFPLSEDEAEGRALP